MTISRKPDAEDINRFLGFLKSQPWLGSARKWWPDFLFRVDNVDSAAAILNSGRLYSREAAMARVLMTTDSASPTVISKTQDRWKSFVRLYFRPRTPTQYSNEGFRPKGQYALQSHCPVPVVMMFDASDILTWETTQFSNGNLAAPGALTGSDAGFLRRIPFEMVYHDEWLDELNKRMVVFHRHAEAIVPNEMDLAALRFIQCRTQAEYETLMCLLNDNARQAFSNKIGVGARANLHFRHWTYMDQVQLDRETIRFEFNRSSRAAGPFYARVEITEGGTGRVYTWERDAFQASDPWC